MKNLNLYQVFDNIGCSTITEVIPAVNDITAALGFRNAYIMNKDPKSNPYQYKALDLRRVAVLEINEDGLVVNCRPSDWTIAGNEIMSFIQEEMQKRGVDDFILDNDEEEK